MIFLTSTPVPCIGTGFFWRLYLQNNWTDLPFNKYLIKYLHDVVLWVGK